MIGNRIMFKLQSKCVLCDRTAIGTAAHIPVCEQHHCQYQKEGRQYLPPQRREVYRKLCRAAEQAETVQPDLDPMSETWPDHYEDW